MMRFPVGVEVEESCKLSFVFTTSIIKMRRKTATATFVALKFDRRPAPMICEVQFWKSLDCWQMHFFDNLQARCDAEHLCVLYLCFENVWLPEDVWFGVIGGGAEAEEVRPECARVSECLELLQAGVSFVVGERIVDDGVARVHQVRLRALEAVSSRGVEQGGSAHVEPF